MVVYMLTGIVVAGLLVLLIRPMTAMRADLCRAGLVIAALVYVGMALVSDVEFPMIDLLGVLLYGLFAWMSIRYGLIWLAVGWALHIGWDIMIHLNSTHVPDWYPGTLYRIRHSGRLIHHLSHQRKRKSTPFNSSTRPGLLREHFDETGTISH